MQDGKRKSIVIDAKILRVFFQNEGWSRVNHQEFTAALSAVLQSLQEHWRAEVVLELAGREESDFSGL